MRFRNELVLKMHWTFESGRDYGRGVLCALHSRRCCAASSSRYGERRSALRAGRIFDTPPLEGRCRAPRALWVYLLNPK
jgi:hypothetical protein